MLRTPRERVPKKVTNHTTLETGLIALVNHVVVAERAGWVVNDRPAFIDAVNAAMDEKHHQMEQHRVVLNAVLNGTPFERPLDRALDLPRTTYGATTK
jgi:hypothetical protein